MQDDKIKELIKQLLQEYVADPTSLQTPITQTGVFATVDEAIAAAKSAQEKYEEMDLATRRKVIKTIRCGMEPLVKEFAQKTFEETGMGRYEDKILKLQLTIDKTPGVEDLKTEAETGDNGMTLYELSAYGVIGAVTPSTNPVETLICNAIGMLAAGNAIFFSVHPGAKKVSKLAIEKLNELVYQACGIQNLVVTIEEPSIEAAQAMMKHPDISLLVVTGGPGVVHQAMTSGKKTIGAGAGNPPAIVDETANIEKAAADIVAGAAFDNNILCIAEKSVIAVKDIVSYLILQMEKNGAYYVDDPTIIQKMLQATLMENGSPSREFIGKNANCILKAAGVEVEYDVRVIIMDVPKDHPFVVKEMLMPILPIVTVENFDEALETALAVEQKLHHTATMHSQNIGRLNRAGKKLQTSIFVKNGPSFAGLGYGGEGTTTFTIATPTGECTTTAKDFARRRRCVLTDGFSIR
ncbi:aldehyde dehydrogenase [Enterococcus florum]|uniref:Aldehyde dehydrogenase n=1 Tax=Enterococcus florum TaxID=2480627 RepID=A0A4P5PB54_9ENTE|nr:aldehyde dehydrogenase family protein [Enterococcus florum]GCF95240.1 aldehyde dehydrogenase [Enterococcus florum]